MLLRPGSGATGAKCVQALGGFPLIPFPLLRCIGSAQATKTAHWSQALDRSIAAASGATFAAGGMPETLGGIPKPNADPPRPPGANPGKQSHCNHDPPLRNPPAGPFRTTSHLALAGPVSNPCSAFCHRAGKPRPSRHGAAVPSPGGLVSDPTNAERSRRFRARKAGKIPPAEKLICSECGAGRSGRYGEICRRCWERVTPEGRAAKAARVARARGRIT
jgi:hypothetical protein